MCILPCAQVGLETRVSLENVQVCALPIFYKAFLLCLIEAHSNDSMQ